MKPQPAPWRVAELSLPQRGEVLFAIVDANDDVVISQAASIPASAGLRAELTRIVDTINRVAQGAKADLARTEATVVWEHFYDGKWMPIPYRVYLDLGMQSGHQLRERHVERTEATKAEPAAPQGWKFVAPFRAYKPDETDLHAPWYVIVPTGVVMPGDTRFDGQPPRVGEATGPTFAISINADDALDKTLAEWIANACNSFKDGLVLPAAVRLDAERFRYIADGGLDALRMVASIPMHLLRVAIDTAIADRAAQQPASTESAKPRGLGELAADPEHLAKWRELLVPASTEPTPNEIEAVRVEGQSIAEARQMLMATREAPADDAVRICPHADVACEELWIGGRCPDCPLADRRSTAETPTPKAVDALEACARLFDEMDAVSWDLDGDFGLHSYDTEAAMVRAVLNARAEPQAAVDPLKHEQMR